MCHIEKQTSENYTPLLVIRVFSFSFHYTNVFQLQFPQKNSGLLFGWGFLFASTML